MSETNLALRRMLKPIRVAPAGAQMTELRAWRLAVPRASERVVGLTAAVTALDEGTSDLAGLLKSWDTNTVIWQLDGDEGWGVGLAILDADALTALIEIQTLRRVGQGAVQPRPKTVVDAALACDTVAAWLKSHDAAIGEGGDRWRLGSQITSPRAAKLLLDEGEYRTRRISFLFGEGARQGTLTLVTPAAPPKGDEEEEDVDRGALYMPEADLVAVLHRGEVPFRWLADLAPGSMLEIPRTALTEVRVETDERRLVARARLGQMSGRRALKLADLTEEDREAEAAGGMAPGASLDLEPMPLGADPMSLGALPGTD